MRTARRSPNSAPFTWRAPCGTIKCANSKRSFKNILLYSLYRAPIPQTSDWSGTFFAVSYSKPVLVANIFRQATIESSSCKHQNPVDMSAYSYELSTVHTSLSAKDAYWGAATTASLTCSRVCGKLQNVKPLSSKVLVIICPSTPKQQCTVHCLVIATSNHFKT